MSTYRLRILDTPPLHPYCNVPFNVPMFLVDHKDMLKCGVEVNLTVKLYYDEMPLRECPSSLLEVSCISDQLLIGKNGMTNIELAINASPTNNDDSKFLILVTGRTDCGTTISSATTTFTLSNRYHLVKVGKGQIPKVWHIGEGRENDMEVKLHLVDASQNSHSNETVSDVSSPFEVRSNQIKSKIGRDRPESDLPPAKFSRVASPSEISSDLAAIISSSSEYCNTTTKNNNIDHEELIEGIKRWSEIVMNGLQAIQWNLVGYGVDADGKPVAEKPLYSMTNPEPVITTIKEEYQRLLAGHLNNRQKPKEWEENVRASSDALDSRSQSNHSNRLPIYSTCGSNDNDNDNNRHSPSPTYSSFYFTSPPLINESSSYTESSSNNESKKLSTYDPLYYHPDHFIYLIRPDEEKEEVVVVDEWNEKVADGERERRISELLLQNEYTEYQLFPTTTNIEDMNVYDLTSEEEEEEEDNSHRLPEHNFPDLELEEIESWRDFMMDLEPMIADDHRVYYIHSRNYYSTAQSMNMGFPAYDINKQLIGFYQEDQSYFQGVTLRISNIENIPESEINFLTNLLEQDLKNDSVAIFKIGDFKNIEEMKEKVLFTYWEIM